MVNVVGLGYIGLPTILMLGAHGVEVTGTDYNSELVDTLNHGRLSFKEEGLEALYQEAREHGVSSQRNMWRLMYILFQYRHLTKKSRKR